MRKQLYRLLAACILFLPLGASAHEGHHGGVPAGPNGGKVKEAAPGSPRDGHATLYFEFLREGDALKIFALKLKDGSAFEVLSPKAELRKVEVRVEYPRSRKTDTLRSVIVSEKSIESPLVPKEPSRYIVHLSAVYGGETQKSKVQFEGK